MIPQTQHQQIKSKKLMKCIIGNISALSYDVNRTFIQRLVIHFSMMVAPSVGATLDK